MAVADLVEAGQRASAASDTGFLLQVRSFHIFLRSSGILGTASNDAEKVYMHTLVSLCAPSMCLGVREEVPM